MQYVSLAIKPKLTFKEIQIWYAHIDREFVRFKAFEQFLSENELKRAQRFHFSKDCRRYIILASQYYTCVMVENRKVNQNYFPQCTTYSVNELLRV